MPHESGFQVLTQVRNDEAFRHIPVVLMSADFRGVHGIRWGAADFIQKPLDREAIQRAAFECIETDSWEEAGVHRVLCVDDDITVLKTLQYVAGLVPLYPAVFHPMHYISVPLLPSGTSSHDLATV